MSFFNSYTFLRFYRLCPHALFERYERNVNLKNKIEKNSYIIFPSLTHYLFICHPSKVFSCECTLSSDHCVWLRKSNSTLWMSQLVLDCPKKLSAILVYCIFRRVILKWIKVFLALYSRCIYAHILFKNIVFLDQLRRVL